MSGNEVAAPKKGAQFIGWGMPMDARKYHLFPGPWYTTSVSACLRWEWYTSEAKYLNPQEPRSGVCAKCLRKSADLMTKAGQAVGQ
jgi:hypothetical protein